MSKRGAVSPYNAAGGGQEGEKDPVYQTSHVPAVTVVGEQAQVDSEVPGLQRCANSVDVAREAAEHGQQGGGGLTQGAGAEMLGQVVGGEVSRLGDDVEAGGSQVSVLSIDARARNTAAILGGTDRPYSVMMWGRSVNIRTLSGARPGPT
jgi:hypothetical protein